MAFRNYGANTGFIVDSNGHGDFTTVQAAINAAVSGDIIYLNPGIYTENINYKNGLLITAAPGSGYHNVIIKGKVTCTDAGIHLFGSIQLETNGDYLLAVSGSAAVIVEFLGSLINCADHTGISFTNTNAGSVISFINCTKNLAVLGVALYTMTSPGNLLIYRSDLENTAFSTTAANNSAGTVALFHCTMSSVHTVSGTGVFSAENCRLDTSQENTTALTLSGTTTANIFNSQIYSGTASCVVVGAGCVFTSAHLTASSTNTNVFTGSGTWFYAYTAFINSSHGHNVSTETALSTF